MVNYNLPRWMCMKSEYSILSLLIPGPRSPGNDIDIYLQPLIDELKLLWDSRVEKYDASRNETFQMRAALIWTISDFPAYAMLSGWKKKLECLPTLVVTMELILAILNIVGKCAILIIVFLYRWIIHGDQTKDHSMEKLNLGLLQLL